MRILMGLLISALVVVGAAGIWIAQFAVRAGPRSGDPQDILFEVRPGQTLKQVAESLEQEQVIGSALKIRIWAKLTGNAGALKVGEYAINTRMSPKEILEVLNSGKSINRGITFSEGLNIFEIADLVEKRGLAKRAEFLKLVRDPKYVQEVLGENVASLEGYLFPETYNLTKYSTVHDLIRSMVTRFMRVYGELESEYGKLPLSRHKLVTLASIVEKETGAPEERPLIASVFYNRMNIHMRLQTDPTVIYGYWAKTGQPLNNITRRDLLTPNAYNTYTIDSLPPGPIANPGRAALAATMRPASSNYLYFVSHNDGTHAFSSSLKQHEENVRKFQLDPHAREGKSWRQLTQPHQNR